MDEKITIREFKRNSRENCRKCKNYFIDMNGLDDDCLKSDLVKLDYENGYCRCQHYECDEFLDRFRLLYDSFPENLSDEVERKIDNLLSEAENLYIKQRMK